MSEGMNKRESCHKDFNREGREYPVLETQDHDSNWTAVASGPSPQVCRLVSRFQMVLVAKSKDPVLDFLPSPPFDQLLRAKATIRTFRTSQVDLSQ